MNFEFAKYTEITDFAFKVKPNYKNEGYIRFFICPDVNDYWFIRVLEGFNEEYEQEEGTYLLERNNIPKSKTEKLSIKKLENIILEDDGSNWDLKQYDDIYELIDDIDGGFGVLNLQTENI